MLWIKAFHIIFMVTWFAGLFYLPRLFVYHVQSNDEISHTRFTVMEQKLFAIMTIGAILTSLFGLILIRQFDKFPLWLNWKLVLVGMLILYHLYCLKVVRLFKNKKNQRSEKFYRWFNEIPAVLLVAIVLLAIVKVI